MKARRFKPYGSDDGMITGKNRIPPQKKYGDFMGVFYE